MFVYYLIRVIENNKVVYKRLTFIDTDCIVRTSFFAYRDIERILRHTN
jgi:hypothetical protein